MKLTKNNRLVSVLGMIIGIVLIIVSIIINNEELKNVSAACIGLGAAILVLSLGYFFNYVILRKNPEYQRAKNIALKDERNIIIVEKAGAKTNNIFIWVLFAVMIIFIALGVELWIVLTLSGLVVVNSIIYAVYAYHYNKRL